MQPGAPRPRLLQEGEGGGRRTRGIPQWTVQEEGGVVEVNIISSSSTLAHLPRGYLIVTSYLVNLSAIINMQEIFHIVLMATEYF